MAGASLEPAAQDGSRSGGRVLDFQRRPRAEPATGGRLMKLMTFDKYPADQQAHGLFLGSAGSERSQTRGCLVFPGSSAARANSERNRGTPERQIRLASEQRFLY